jgi:UPF0716 family protein affecting phage T7 exclusion
MLGVLVVRVAGLATALKARESLNRGELPAQQMLEGLMLALGGGLLVLPGFISDAAGLLLLLPPVRRFLVNRCASVLKNRRSASVRLPMISKPHGGHAPISLWGVNPM